MSGARPFNADGRAQVLAIARQGVYDIVVVGGGITGAGVARDAAMRGLRVALFERGDFACSTSSASSKLLHGGIRYLEQKAFHLVWEALQERARQCQLIAHLAHPTPFLFPLYEGDPVSPALLDLGLWVYDAMAGYKNLGLHRRLSAASLRQLEPALRAQGLRGGCSYYDAVTDDARLTLENARSAWEHGADCVPYVEVDELIEADGEIRGLRVRDVLDGEGAASLTVRARCVVNACGPWSDLLRSRGGLQRRLVRPTKGVHLTVRRACFPRDHAVVMSSPRDHRILFAIPWGTLAIVGTTDTDYDPRNGPPQATAEDVAYILDIARHYFPDSPIEHDDILSTWAGLRPLYHPESDGAPSSVSREHKIVEERPGLVTVVGGKLTTYRIMARQVVDLAAQVAQRRGAPPAGRCQTADEVLVTRLDDSRTPPSTLPADTFAHLCAVYGPRAVAVGELARLRKDTLGQQLTAHAPDIAAQIVYAFESEMAMHLADVLARRPRASHAGIRAEEIARAASIARETLGWSEDRLQAEMRRVDEEQQRWRVPDASSTKGR